MYDNVYQNDAATLDEEMYLEYEYLDDGAAPYLRKHGGRVYGTKRAAFLQYSYKSENSESEKMNEES